MKKIGRNDPCPCGAKKVDGSPVKYKKCHLLSTILPMQNSDNSNLSPREIGGQRMPNGVVIGPMYFGSGDGSHVISLGPPIVSFDFGVASALNRLRDSTLEQDEFLTEFNTMLENLVADFLIYFQNRLKLILKKSSVGQMNSVDAAIKEYRRASIDLSTLCDIEFLRKLDRVRGRKHHSDQRYHANFAVDAVNYDNVGKLREMAETVKNIIHVLDEKLELSHPSYVTKIEENKDGASISWTTVGHAFDLTGKGRIVSKKNPND